MVWVTSEPRRIHAVVHPFAVPIEAVRVVVVADDLPAWPWVPASHFVPGRGQLDLSHTGRQIDSPGRLELSALPGWRPRC